MRHQRCANSPKHHSTFVSLLHKDPWSNTKSLLTDCGGPTRLPIPKIKPVCSHKPYELRTGVGIADDGVAGAAAEGHDLVVGWAGHGAVDVELVDDEVRLEPPACASNWHREFTVADMLR